MAKKILVLSGSLRAASRNTALARYALRNAPEGLQLEMADLSEFPFYNADHPAPPPPVARFFEQLRQADGLLLACPEYNYSIAPVLKNALDWASREKDNHLLAGKTVALMGAGGGMGTSRAQYHLRQVAVALDLRVLNKPEVFCSAFTAGLFDEHNELVDERIQGLVKQLLEALKTALAR
ncbi:NADPH-dependent FMN reductase [Pelomonas sp. BJYL3]|uniref:NADPH-dependent FMN reductase n=1 Tax=Pelomonas sp. BJYL3 TaxID=2976697 RepID=UPI0022B57FEE|nr:NADPH-dependent FMN reductase [Pelomonas sp. BJYL3]